MASPVDLNEVYNHHLQLQQAIIKQLEALCPDGTKFVKVDVPTPEGVINTCYLLERTGECNDVTDPRFVPIERAGVVVTLAKGRKMPSGVVPTPGTNVDVEIPPAGVTFDAAHISVMVHPRSPHAPICHDNRRTIVSYDPQKSSSDWWFGGASNLTPSLLYKEDAVDWHQGIKDNTSEFGVDSYHPMKKWCDEYFHNPHFKETRGIGGIFFDNLSTKPHERLDIKGSDTQRPKSFEQCLEFSISTMTKLWSDTYVKILRDRGFTSWTAAERDHQLTERGRFIDHFLACDIGFRFGLQTKSGSLTAMRLILPPYAQWVHDPEFEPESEKAKLKWRFSRIQ
ncbi:coproporphyrinogen III oxidase [Ceratobasidium sp. AG-Ba]|nr:coproporphyrinogen III oxidase [Ceratobasidium sp. AG-Ba]